MFSTSYFSISIMYFQKGAANVGAAVLLTGRTATQRTVKAKPTATIPRVTAVKATIDQRNGAAHPPRTGRKSRASPIMR